MSSISIRCFLSSSLACVFSSVSVSYPKKELDPPDNNVLLSSLGIRTGDLLLLSGKKEGRIEKQKEKTDEKEKKRINF